MSIVMLKRVRIAFPALAAPQSIGEGDPAFGGRFVIEPDDAKLVKQLDDAMAAAAKAKWKDDAPSILAMLVESRKTAFEHRPYISTKTGKPYAGFEGKFNLGTRTPINKPRPSVFDKAGEPLVVDGKALVPPSDIERLVYSGCYVHAKVEFWAQDNSFGRRVNCTLLGVRFAEAGDSFGGGSAPAGRDDFAEFDETDDDAAGVL